MNDTTPDPLRQLIIAAHASLEDTIACLDAAPELLDVAYDWGERGGLETPLGAAAHVGRHDIAQHLLARGATLTPVAAASLGMREALEAFIEADPATANATGAHGISILSHAVHSGDTAILDLLAARGNTLAAVNAALASAASAGNRDAVVWLLGHGADPTAQSIHGKTAIEIADARGHADIVALLQRQAE